MDALKWFKFSPTDWSMGKIKKLSNDHQSLYISLCCIYWKNAGELDTFTAELEVGKDILTDLSKYKIIKVENDQVSIDFLDKQLAEINELSELKRKAAVSRWNAKAMQKDTGAMHVHTDAMPIDKNRIDKNRIEYPFDSNEFKKAFNYWTKYKKEQFNFIYKPSTLKAALTGLKNKSNGNEQDAIKIIYRSIENGWKGFFDLPKEDKTKSAKFGTDQEHELVRKSKEYSQYFDSYFSKTWMDYEHFQSHVKRKL